MVGLALLAIAVAGAGGVGAGAVFINVAHDMFPLLCGGDGFRAEDYRMIHRESQGDLLAKGEVCIKTLATNSQILHI